MNGYWDHTTWMNELGYNDRTLGDKVLGNERIKTNETYENI